MAILFVLQDLNPIWNPLYDINDFKMGWRPGIAAAMILPEHIVSL